MRVPRLGRKPKLEPVTFISAADFFEPQVPVKALKDVSGWIDRKRKQKWSLSAGKTYHLDVETATEFITKGYVEGQLPRDVSSGEEEEWKAQMTTIGVQPDG